MLISRIELGLAKKLHQLFLHLIFLYLSLFLPSSISVVRCCYESSFMKITRDVRFLGKQVKTQTFQSGNHERQNAEKAIYTYLFFCEKWGKRKRTKGNPVTEKGT